MPLDSPREPDAWVREYVGIPFLDRGRDRRGCDCWGLVRLVLGERFGVDLPDYSEGYEGNADWTGIAQLIGSARESGAWSRIDSIAEARVGDVVVLRGIPPHIGVVVSRTQMLSSERDANSGLADLTLSAYREALTPNRRHPYPGIYRYRGAVPATTSRSLDGEVLEPGQTVRLYIAPHPFRITNRTEDVPAGLSIEEMFERHQPNRLLRAHGVAFLNEVRITERRLWRRIRPKAGTRVQIRALPPVPQGSRKTLRAVLLLALVAAAIAIPYIIPGIIGKFVAAGVLIGGGLLVNAFLPTQQDRLRQDNRQDSPTFNVEGVTNILRPYAPVPFPLGFHKYVAPLAARAYRQLIAGQVYYYIMLLWGYGPVKVTELKIGETPIEEFEDVLFETVEGYPDDPPLSLFSNDVFEEIPGITLRNADSWVTRRTQIDTDEIDLDLTFPRGLVWFQEDGDRKGREVKLAVRYAPAGTEDWTDGGEGTATAAGSLDLGPPPSGTITYQVGTFPDPVITVTEPRSRWDAVVVDRLSGEVGKWQGPDSYVYRETIPPWFLWRPRYPIPIPPKNKAVVAWVKRYANETGAIPAGRISDRRSSPTVVPEFQGAGFERPPCQMFNTSDVRVASNRINLPSGWIWQNGEILRAQSTGTLPGGIPSGTDLYVRDRADETYRLSLSEGGTPIEITDQGTGTHYLSNSFLNPATDFVVSAAVAARTVDYTGGTVVFQGLTIQGDTTSVLRTGLNIKVAKDQYDVQVRRISADNNIAGLFDEVVWTGLRSIKYVDPWNLPGVARTAIQIRASGQLEGRIEPISAVLQRVAKIWDSGAQNWDTEDTTQNPAALFRLVAQSPANKAARTDAQLDLPAIEAWYEECEAQGWAFNMVVDFRTTVPEMLDMIAAAGMATPAWRDGKLSVVQDVLKTVEEQIISPANSSGYRGNLVWPDIPHGFKVRFIDETSGYKNNERIVYDDGYDPSNASVFYALEFPGTTDPDLIWRRARRRLAEARLRPETHRTNMHLEALTTSRGGMVAFAHNAIKVGLGSGRIKAVGLGGGGEALTVTIEGTVDMEAGGSYVLRIRDSAKTQIVEPVDTVAGRQSLLTFTTPVVAPTFKAGDSYMFGELGAESRQCLITYMRPNPKQGFEVTLIDLAPDVFRADDLATAFGPGDVDTTADTIGPSGHGFFDGDLVQLATDGTLPVTTAGPLQPLTSYQVVGADDAAYQISDDLDSPPASAPPLDLVNGGSGNHTATRQIPPFDAGISEDPTLPEETKPAAPVIEDIRSDESVMTRAPDGGLEVRIAIRFRIPPTDTAPDSVEAQIRESASGGPWRRAGAVLLPTDELVIGDVETGQLVDLRLRTITRLGIPSDWTVETAYTVEGTTAPPPDVESLYIDDDVARWQITDPPLDLAGYRLRWHEGINRTWSTAAPLFDGLVTGPDASVAVLGPGTKTLLVKAVDVNGTESETAASAVLDIVIPVDPRWEIGRRDLKALGFPGTIVNGTVEGTGPATTLDRAAANHGTVSGAPTWIRGLKGNSALRFDGENRAVFMGDVHDFTGTAPFTLAARFRARIPTNIGTGQHYVIAGKVSSTASDGYLLWVSANDNTIRGTRYGSGTATQLAGPVLQDQQEYVAALVYDGTNLRLVLDGVTVDGPDASAQSYVDFTGGFVVGLHTHVTTYRFRGTIDEVQVWNTARSNAQIAADTADLLEGSALTAAIANGLVGYWPFEEGTINGDLVGLPLERSWKPEADALPGWGDDDFAAGWAEVYGPLTYSTTYEVPETLLPSDLDRAFTVTTAGPRGVRYRMQSLDDQPGWPAAVDTAPGWQVTTGPGGIIIGLDDALTWLREQDFVHWPGRLKDVKREGLFLQVRIAGGERQPRISEAVLRHIGHQVEDSLEDVAIAATGTRLVFATAFRFIQTLFLTLQDDGGTAVALKVIDKDPGLGPLVVALDSAGAQTTATIDATAKGLL